MVSFYLLLLCCLVVYQATFYFVVLLLIPPCAILHSIVVILHFFHFSFNTHLILLLIGLLFFYLSGFFCVLGAFCLTLRSSSILLYLYCILGGHFDSHCGPFASVYINFVSLVLFCIPFLCCGFVSLDIFPSHCRIMCTFSLSFIVILCLYASFCILFSTFSFH